jgi:dTDP-4-dehydrorhamnose reductase
VPTVLPVVPPRTLIVGASGFLGRHFLAAYRAADPGTPATSHRDPTLQRLDLACRAPEPPARKSTGYTSALLLAACSNVAECEREPAFSRRVNVEGTLAVAERLLDAGSAVVFFSSDYVFSGDEGSYDEESATGPRTEYGRQKREVEQRLLERDPSNVLVIRLSKIYDLEPGGGTLLDELATRLIAGRVVRAAWDQVFCPTFVDDVVLQVARLQALGARGLVHLCAPQAWARYDLAREMARALAADPSLVERISLSEIELPGERPLDTSMSCSRLQEVAPHEFRPVAASIRELAGRRGAAQTQRGEGE